MLADEEALTNLADHFMVGDSPADEVGRRFHSLRRNRRRKNWVRSGLLKSHAHKVVRADQAEMIEDPSFNAESAELISMIKFIVPRPALAILEKLAEGSTYSELALEFGVATGKLRTEICRLRQSLRRLHN